MSALNALAALCCSEMQIRSLKLVLFHSKVLHSLLSKNTSLVHIPWDSSGSWKRAKVEFDSSSFWSSSMSAGSMSCPSSQSDNSDADSAGLVGRLPGKVKLGSSPGLNLQDNKMSVKEI